MPVEMIMQCMSHSEFDNDEDIDKPWRQKKTQSRCQLWATLWYSHVGDDIDVNDKDDTDDVDYDVDEDVKTDFDEDDDTEVDDDVDDDLN